MRFRERNERETGTPSGGQPPVGSGADGQRWLDAMRLLAHSDDAIDRAMGRDSQAFLEATRQEGGQ